MWRPNSVLGSLWTIAAVLGLVSCGGGSSIPPVAPISISVSPMLATVPLNSMPGFTATVQNDSANAGVNWALVQNGTSCSPGCGTLSSNNTSSGTANTYTPPTMLPANTKVTLTATSVTDPTKSAAATITLAPPSIVVTLSAANPTVEAGGTDIVTAAVSNDPANKGVSAASWTLSPATGAGTLTNTNSMSAIYNAPASAPVSDLTVTITGTSASDPTQSGSVTITVPAISISLSAANAGVEAGSTDIVTATVTNDPSNKGVSVSSWTLSPATGAGTLTNATTSSATYNAPAAPPASDVTVTVSATSISDPTKMGSASIVVQAIAVSAISPTSALIPLNVSQEFVTAVQYDPANKGINWSLLQAGTSCSPTCGTVVPTNTASGTPTTYTAPTLLPPSTSVEISATSASDNSKSANANITISNGTVKLVPNTFNFGTLKVNGHKSGIILLTNTGNTALTVSGITTASPFAQSNNCGNSVASGVTCTITASVSSSQTGGFHGQLTISDSSVDSPQTVSLIANVIARGEALLGSSLATETRTSVPRPTGFNSVGTRILDLVDPTRDDPYSGDSSKRELLVRMWYPASVHQDCVPADYTPPMVWSYYSQLLGIPLPDVNTNSCLNAAVSSGTYPVVIFTPGYTATFTDYTFLFEDIASRGFVVVSVDHTYEATAVAFPDGRFVKSLFGSSLGGELRSGVADYTSAVDTRLADLKFVLDELDRLNSSAKGPFAGKLDTSRVALAGHSLGGLTTILALQQEPRVKAGIVLDGVMPQSPIGATSKPVFIVTAGHTQWSNEECQVWNNLMGPRISLNLSGADHIAPTDAVWLAKSGINTGTMSPEQTVEVLRSNISAFLDANLRANHVNSLPDISSVGHSDSFASHQSQEACSEK